ncbi:hypothetical protein L6164_008636 [Bauhinia variegata]|uniref:Uncharacterized protein n=1 Tax=Bauhinia variegata TaxID=167791 RepID=A0ACB9PIT6_BAUVA|nr:hypothetical protein L6164_008636 [Bauhinia variegata]
MNSRFQPQVLFLVQYHTVLAKKWQRSKSGVEMMVTLFLVEAMVFLAHSKMDVNDPHFSHLPHKQPALIYLQWSSKGENPASLLAKG